MDIIIRAITRGGVGAFFFFSWIIQLLWNSILVDQLALAPVKVTYWQAAGLWFLVTLLFAWVAIARRPRSHALDVRWDHCGDVARRVKREIRSHVRDWLRDEPEEDLEDLGDHIERRIKEKLRDWSDE